MPYRKLLKQMRAEKAELDLAIAGFERLQANEQRYRERERRPSTITRRAGVKRVSPIWVIPKKRQ